MNLAHDDRLPDYIEIASFKEVSEEIYTIWNDRFVPQCLGDQCKFLPFDAWEDVEIGLNPYALTSAIGNALIDIQRWSIFHLDRPANDEKARPDRHKYAGFIARWLAKERPIYLHCKDPNTPVSVPAEMYRLNAFFAVTVMQAYIRADFDPTLVDELAYILHFRDERGETLALLAYCAERLGVLEAFSN